MNRCVSKLKISALIIHTNRLMDIGGTLGSLLGLEPSVLVIPNGRLLHTWGMLRNCYNKITANESWWWRSKHFNNAICTLRALFQLIDQSDKNYYNFEFIHTVMNCPDMPKTGNKRRCFSHIWANQWAVFLCEDWNLGGQFWTDFNDIKDHFGELGRKTIGTTLNDTII